MAVNRWTELPGRAGRELARELRGLRGNERLAVLGVGAIAGSLALPWYDAPVPGLVQTGFGGFSWAEAAMLLTCAAVVFLSMRVGGGYVPPRPLKEWALFVAAGAWICLIIIYLAIDRPDLDFDVLSVDVQRTYGLGYGLFVAFGGALVIIVAGARSRGDAFPPRSRHSRSRSP